MNLKVLENEHWWGGTIRYAKYMPFDANTNITVDLTKEIWTQTAPLYLSDKGRIIWSEEPFCIRFESGTITLSGDVEILVEQAGETLKSAYTYAMKEHFPFEKHINLPREFFRYPQFNTWMELIKEQTQEGILAYAEEIVKNGYGAGVLMIDDGWQQSIGTWEFNRTLFSDPKGMIERLHELGFKVMLWIAPYVSPDSPDFIKLIEPIHNDGKEMQHLVRNEKGEVAIFRWWNGFSAMLDMHLEGDVAFIDKQLRTLMDEYGVDGFKFDGGSYMAEIINGTSFYGGYSRWELSRVWTEYCGTFEFHEFKDTFKAGGKAYIQRLHDKSHEWVGRDAMDSILPAGIFTGLIGSPFICPDMVGGGSWTTFMENPVDEELFMRMTECSALFPMMQFSYLPWRHTSKECAKTCLDMANLHERLFSKIEQCLSDCERTGEPIVRNMEYNYPNQGYANIRDQYFVGEDILVAPVVNQGERIRKVVLPAGEWKNGNDGTTYAGNQTVEVLAPVNLLPWFYKR